MRASYPLLDNFERDGIPVHVLSVLGPPGGIPHERIQKHGLVLSIGNARRRPLLAEERTRLFDVGEVRCVARFVHERVERGESAPYGGRIGEARKVGFGRHKTAVGLHPGADGPVTESVAVFVLAVQQVKGHGGVAVSNVHSRVGTNVVLHGFAERKVRVLCTRMAVTRQRFNFR